MGMRISAAVNELCASTSTEKAILVSLALVGLTAGGVLSLVSPAYALIGGGALVFAILLMLQRYEMVLALILIARILQDYYRLITLPLFFPFIAFSLAVLTLGWLFLTQSASAPWIGLRYFWLWVALLALTGFSLLRSADHADGATYFANTICSALIFWALGTQLSRDAVRLRQLFSLLVAGGAAIGAHAILAARTGVF